MLRTAIKIDRDVPGLSVDHAVAEHFGKAHLHFVEVNKTLHELEYRFGIGLCGRRAQL